MAWFWLLGAGAFEIGFATSLAASHGFTRPAAGVASVVLGALAVVALSRALRSLPLSVGYAVFTGIGTVGATAFDVLRGRRLSALSLVAIALVVMGGVLLRVQGNQA